MALGIRSGVGVTLLLLLAWGTNVSPQTPFWQRTGGPEGGNIYSLAVGPGGDLYARNYWGLVHRSVDDGGSWTPIRDFGEGCLKACEACDCTASSAAVAPDDTVYVGSGNRIFRSEDHGDSWTATGFNGYPHAIAISPGGALFVSDGADQVHVSMDQGQTWAVRNAGLEGQYVLRFTFDSSGHVLAATRSGVFSSMDAGATWHSYGLDGQVISALEVNPANGDILAGTATNGCDKTYRRRGSQWSEVSLPVCFATDFAFPAGGPILAATYQNEGVWQSMDEGWTFTYAGLGNWDHGAEGMRSVWALAIQPGSGHVFAASGDGVFRSSDGGASWSRLFSGMKGADASAILGTSNGSVFAGTDRSGIFRTQDKGATWARPAQVVQWPDIAIPLVADAQPFGSMLEDTHGHLFAAFAYFAMSMDNGNTWVGAMPEWRCGFSSCQAHALALGPTGDVYVAGGPELGIQRSGDHGQTWQVLEEYCKPECQGPTFGSLAVSPNGTVFAGTRPGTPPEFRGLYRSTDDGETWDVSFPGEEHVSSIAVDSLGRVFAATSQGLQRSEDNGVTWHEVKAFISWRNVVAVSRDDRIFVGHLGGGVFVSDDHGETWTDVSAGLTSLNIASLGFDRDGYLYAGTFGSGVFRSVEPAGAALRRVASVAPAHLWVGLKNSDDQGTRFDLRTDLYQNGSLVSSGTSLCVTGVTRNPSLAKEVWVPFGAVTSGSLRSGDELELRVLTRIGTKADGSRCGGHANATGLRLYYDASLRPSRFGTEIVPEQSKDYYLRSDGSQDRLDTEAPASATAKKKDSGSLRYCGGSPWSMIGSWTLTVP